MNQATADTIVFLIAACQTECEMCEKIALIVIQLKIVMTCLFAAALPFQPKQATAKTTKEARRANVEHTRAPSSLVLLSNSNSRTPRRPREAVGEPPEKQNARDDPNPSRQAVLGVGLGRTVDAHRARTARICCCRGTLDVN